MWNNDVSERGYLELHIFNCQMRLGSFEARHPGIFIGKILTNGLIVYVVSNASDGNDYVFLFRCAIDD